MPNSTRILRVIICFAALFVDVPIKPQSSQPTCPAANCPPYAQLHGDNGMSNDANMRIILLDTSTGSFNDPVNQMQSIADAIDGWAATPGNNQDYTVEHMTSGDVATLEAAGTASRPVVVLVIDSGHCNGYSCSEPHVDSTQTTTSATTWMSPAEAAGTDPYEGSLPQLMSHEIGAHDDYGWADCANSTACNTNSGTGSATYTKPPGPTDCDICQAIQCGR